METENLNLLVYSQMPRTGPGQSHKPGMQSRPSAWMADTQAFELSPIAREAGIRSKAGT